MLGRLLVAAGDAVSDVESRLRRIAARWGDPDIQLMVLPRVVVLASASGGRPRVVARGADEPGLRLDQAGAVFEVARAVQRGEMDPASGLAVLRAVPAMAARFGLAGSILGQVLVTLGVGLLLRPAGWLVGLYVGLGLLVALLREAAGRLGGETALLPVMAAGLVSVIAFTVADGRFDVTSVQALVPPLVLLLPGALLATATVDLAAGEAVTGASRFVAGFMQLALLAFGIFAGAALVGTRPAARPAVAGTQGWWVPWLGVLVFAAGIALMRSAPARQLPWLLLVLAAAFGAQLAGSAVIGARLSGFAGGLAATLVAVVLERFRTAPPAFVSFLPAFWLLAPGAIGLLGVAQLVSEDPSSGVGGLIDAGAAIISIALGVLVGVGIVRIGTLGSPAVAKLRARRHATWPGTGAEAARRAGRDR